MMISYLETYKPLLWILMLSAVLAGCCWLISVQMSFGSLPASAGMDLFMLLMGYFVACLGFLKILDLQAFIAEFRQYDVLTQRWPIYGVVFPFCEIFVAICVIAGVWPIWASCLAIFMGVNGWVSIHHRLKTASSSAPKLSCGCAGGHLKLPLGTMSMVENAMMVVMGAILLLTMMNVFS